MKTYRLKSWKSVLLLMVVHLVVWIGFGDQVTAQQWIHSGESTAGSIDSPGVMATFQFTGEAGNGVVITAENVDGDFWPEIVLYDPFGNIAATAYGSSEAMLDNHILAESGIYTIGIRDGLTGTRTGSFILCLLTIPGATSMGEICSGQSVEGNVEADFESFSFYGEAGQGIVMTAANIGGDFWPEIRLYDPSGILETSGYGSSEAMIDNHHLQETGTYVIVIKDGLVGPRSGNFILSLLTIPGATNMGGIVSGDSWSGSVDANFQSLTFYGDAGNGIAIVVSNTSGDFWPEIRLYAPSGFLEESAYGSSQAIIEDFHLAETGWYVIVIKDGLVGPRYGTFDLSFLKFPGQMPPIMSESPAHGEMVAPIGVVLSWDDTWGASSYDVYFGDAYPLQLVANDIVESHYVCPALTPGTRYDWHVILNDVGGEDVPGPYWRFDTTAHEQTVTTELTCLPSSGTLPFTTQMTATLTNNFGGQTRRIAGRIDFMLANGGYYPSWRAGFTNVEGGGVYTSSWNQSIPNLGSLVGNSVFTLVAEDVTPAPYNQPPYPPAGDTDSASCTVTGIAP